MESKVVNCIIVKIGPVKTSEIGTKKSLKQILVLKEPGFEHATDPKRNGVDNHYEVEIYNDKIEKFNLSRFTEGQKVKASLWINGAYRQTRDGQVHKTTTILATIEAA